MEKMYIGFHFPRKIPINFKHPNCVQNFGLVEQSVPKWEIELEMEYDWRLFVQSWR